MNILITGVTGFVGSSLVKYFQQMEGIKLYGHGRSAQQIQKQYPGIVEFVPTLTVDRLNVLDIDCIIHLAGIAHDLNNKYVDADYYRVNYEDSAKLYNIFLSSKVSKFIYLSSIKSAVDHINSSADEQVVPNPVTPYGKSKLKAELYIQSQIRPETKSVYLLRPCMIHGPGNKGNLNLLYRFVKTSIPYPLGAFDNRRSFLSADNLSFIIYELIHQTVPSGIYHLADDGTLSTKEVVATIGRAIEKKTRIWNVPSPLVKLVFKLAGKTSTLSKLTENMEVSNRKIKKAIQKPLPVSIEKGLIKTIRSFQ